MDIAILSNVPVKLGQAKPLKSKLDSLSMEGGFQTVEIPILIVTSNPYLQNLINLFLLDKASNNYKDLSSVAKAMKTWVRWLIENRVDPFAIAKTKSKSPTYGFRQYLLERVHEKSNLKSSTANKYMLTIEAFYKMLAQEGIVQQKHFYRSKLSIIDGYRKLQSSDLAIRVSRALEGNLRPLDHETQRKALQVVEQENEEFKLAFKLMMFSGLRLNESLSFPCFLLLDECFPIDG
ncbi:hypothetical protein NTE14_004100, partial [Vibrio harveyi]|nr:hypothetical protein [Vibrio harveyi]